MIVKALTSLHLLLCAAILALAIQGTASAAINIANGAPIIGGSGDYPDLPFNSGSYASYNVTDGQNAVDPGNNIGPISEPGQDGSFWLGWERSSTGYFVLDFGFSYR